ncbi:alanine--tRNA ligase [Solicola gregarius]|uniref:Alanine--tRNA ligase n=1 Tax=Solicola gregarius TaxID=2908642 RepID=A0AA46TGA8_9ACTN|nr:alanine--tRNA ligase [Solicola gregarius]UYM04824.1 alanine--tRNA ligase [Solicola gregarius]
MKTAEIKRRFLEHFEKLGHTVVPSAPLPFDDPNLLFINAGMVQFVPYLSGQQTPPWERAVSVQKCIRTLDIEEVGKTSRHVTFFQMNGNFSFGDYFKAGAIEYAWSLLTGPIEDGGLGLDPNRLWATTFENDDPNLPNDDEATELWRRYLPAERIQRRGIDDNFWSMSIAGPCGPCSEIFYDRGPQYGVDGGPIVDEDRFVEIWNLVFMQFDGDRGHKEPGFQVLGELPNKNIDTGMGLERVASILQGVDNLYEIDEVFPVIERAAELSRRTYGWHHEDNVRFRIVADHVRSALMLMGDGVTPGNEGRGYVLRRLIRRAVRSMRLLGVDGPTMPELLPVSMNSMKGAYPELEADFARISKIAYAEEDAFAQTLVKGTEILDIAVSNAKQAGHTRLGGDEAFQLHDTYGFPIDLTLEMASEQGLSVDEDGFRTLMAEQRRRAKADAAAKKGQHADTTVYRGALERFGETEWLAYDQLRTESQVQLLIGDSGEVPEVGEGQVAEVVLSRTPFYAESGGQSADGGTITWDGGRAEVIDVQRPITGLVAHQVRVLEGALRSSSTIEATVDEQWRLGACQAHSATHIIHAALRQHLGPTALQRGSYNRPGFLRLDFGWNSSLNEEELHLLEATSNDALRQDLPVTASTMPLAAAKEMGALALFGERYPDLVRVVEIDGPWSRELCGGTHVESTSQIGTMVLTSEGSVSAGSRRVEMVTGREGFGYLARERDLVHQLSEMLKTPRDDLPGRVQDIVERLRAAEKELERLKVGRLLSSAPELAAAAKDVAGVAYVGHRAPDGASAGDVRKLVLDVRGRLGSERPAVVAVVGSANGKPSCVVAVNDRARELGFSANDLVKVAAGVLGGSGGGKDDIAQGGGVDASNADAALTALEQGVVQRAGR